MNEKRIRLLSEHYGIAFWLFYMVIPFVLTRTGSPLLLLNMTGLLLGGYLILMFQFYRCFFTLKHYLFDSLLMLAGLTVFYWFGLAHRSLPGFDLTLYLFLAFTYLPTALRLEAHKRRLTARR